MDAKTAWPDRVIIDGTEFKARRDADEGSVNVPYTTEPEVSVGDVITQKVGRSEVSLEVLEVSFQPNGSLGIGTHHRHLLTLVVEGTTSQAHTSSPTEKARPVAAPVRVAATVYPRLDDLVRKIAASKDAGAVQAMRTLLENKQVQAFVGPGATGLLDSLK
ncbi:MAG TPA: hypothetical protein VGO76_14595 [Luteibacter sp.]|jgi:hypothetical protein|nr:hypothetical protein [Luteibacter sp.]